MIYFDSHFHFDPEDDLDEVLNRMQAAFAAAGGTPED
jgi:predicted urease superfamily metal-dependent hydrolase